eukprot:9087855-Pyramimonas_sp.AAC.1
MNCVCVFRFLLNHGPRHDIPPLVITPVLGRPRRMAGGGRRRRIEAKDTKRRWGRATDAAQGVRGVRSVSPMPRPAGLRGNCGAGNLSRISATVPRAQDVVSPVPGVARNAPGPRFPQDFQGGPHGLLSTLHEAHGARWAPEWSKKLGIPWAEGACSTPDI